MESKKVKYKRCEKCDKKAYYNTPDSRSPRFCGIHREPGLVNVVCTKCTIDGCMKQPCFNFEGKISKFCADHKEKGMVNLRERPCEKCSKKPVYNFPDIKKGRFCVEHREEGMIDVLSKICEHDGCRVRPSFGYKEENKRRFCVQHKLDNMINLMNILCIYEGCETCASFNFKGEKDVLYCKKHKKEGMILVKGPHCADPDCIVTPVFNFPGSKHGKFCRRHRTDGMIDVINPRCKTPMCGLHTPKDYCARCTSYLFPDQPTRFKTRELKLKEYLQEIYPDKTIVHDKRVECHLYRPDFVFDMGSHTVVIELDENQHEKYDTSCDNKRLMSIFQGLGSRPMVMIRFNPDRYDDISGCFKKDGQLTGNGKEWKKRTGQLKDRIDYWLSTEPGREISVEHLFFDTE